MKGLHPILMDDPESPEARLLRAAGLDEPSASNKRRVLAAVGAGSGIAAAAAARTAAASASRGAGVALTKVVAAIKVVAVAAIAAGATVGVAGVAGLHLPLRPQFRLRALSALAPRSPQGNALPLPKVAPAPVTAHGEDEPAAPSESQLRPVAVAPCSASAQVDGRHEATTGSPPVRELTTRRDPANESPHLTQELAVLHLVRQEVAASDPGSALRSLDQYEGQFVRPQLEPEAMALRVEALVGLKRMAEARAVAGRLLASDSGRAYANRVRSILEREEPGASGQ